LTRAAAPVNLCRDTHHFVGFNVNSSIPPGTVCACGQKVLIYEPCGSCGQRAPTLKNAVTLQEGDLYA
jgi:hypothetical protein